MRWQSHRGVAWPLIAAAVAGVLVVGVTVAVVTGDDDGGDTDGATGSSTTSTTEQSGSAVPLSKCPFEEPVGEVSAEQLTVLARDATGDWLLVGSEADPASGAWAPAALVDVGDVDALTVARCGDTELAAGAAPVIGRVPGFAQRDVDRRDDADAPPPRRSDDTASPGDGGGGGPEETGDGGGDPPPPPQGGGDEVSGGSVPSVDPSSDHDPFYEAPASGHHDAARCADDPTVISLRATVDGSEPIVSVTVEWDDPDGTGREETMTKIGDSVYETSVGPYGTDTLDGSSAKSADLLFLITAEDEAGSSQTVPFFVTLNDSSTCPDE